jgi:predicted TIM-barrel fold metal-dependent hydrolase
MVDVSPGSGNQYIIEEVNKARGRLFPTWTILPPITEAEFAPEPLFRRMKENGVRMLRAYPERNRYLLNAVTMGELVREIESARIPLYLSPSTGWQDIYTILQQFPGLTVMIHNYGLWSSNRFLYPLLQAYPNVYIESGDMQTAGEIKDICRKFGSEKIVFGSDYPSNHMGGPLAALLGADISREERANIAHRNIERIWSEVRL